MLEIVTSPVMENNLIGNYRILDVIGRGGMGVVYRGEQVSLGRKIAIKTLPINIAHDDEYLKRIENEAQILAKISHPNIVSIHDRIRQDDAIYLIMEYVQGITVAERIKNRGPYSIEEAARIIVRVAVALEHAHNQGIIHRDIKPSNIMIRRDNVVKVTDFGIAKSSEGTAITSKRCMLGTRQYMSPEQAQARPDIDARSDIYSLGVVFYLMVTGHLPPFPLSDHLPLIPTIYEKIIKKCLQADRDKRYQTARALIIAMDDAKEKWITVCKKSIKRQKSERNIKLSICVLTSALLTILFIWQLDRIKEYTDILLTAVFQDQSEKSQIEEKAVSRNTLTGIHDVTRPIVLHHTVDPSGDKAFLPTPVLRSQAERTDEIRKTLKQTPDIYLEGGVRRLFALKTGVIQDTATLPELAATVQTLFDKMDMIQTVQQGPCDLLISMNMQDQEISMAIDSNLFDSDKTDIYHEIFSSTDHRQIILRLETAIKKYYCFNLLRAMQERTSKNDYYAAVVALNGGTKDVFHVGEKMEICLQANHAAYSMLFSLNAEGLYLLFPQTRAEHRRLTSGTPLCAGPMAVYPPIGLELVTAILLAEKPLFPIDRYLAGEEQAIIEPMALSYDLKAPDNAVAFCESLFTRLSKIQPGKYSVYSQFIRTRE